MKRCGNIYDKICDMDNLRMAHKCAKEDKLFYEEVKMVDSDPDKYLSKIREMLLNDTYEVSDYTISIINDKGKPRELAKLPYFPDRIILKDLDPVKRDRKAKKYMKEIYKKKGRSVNG